MTPTPNQYGYISPEPARPCLACAAIGRLTWLAADGTCRREDVHAKSDTYKQEDK